MKRIFSKRASTTGRIATYLRILERLAELLREGGHVFQAQMIEKLVLRIRSGENLSIVETNDIWGGMGSVGDCSMLDGDGSDDHARRNELELCDLLIALAGLMIDDGIASELTESRKATFEWRRSQV